MTDRELFERIAYVFPDGRFELEKRMTRDPEGVSIQYSLWLPDGHRSYYRSISGSRIISGSPERIILEAAEAAEAKRRQKRPDDGALLDAGRENPEVTIT